MARYNADAARIAISAMLIGLAMRCTRVRREVAAYDARP